MKKEDNILEKLQEFKKHFPFMTDDDVYALLMMSIHLIGNNIPFMLLGDVAWGALGLPLKKEITEIDIQITCKDENHIAIFRGLANDQNNRSYLEAGKPYEFNLFGAKFRIWVSDTFLSESSLRYSENILLPNYLDLLKFKYKNNELDYCLTHLAEEIDQILTKIKKS